jgi:hypothetical protein
MADEAEEGPASKIVKSGVGALIGAGIGSLAGPAGPFLGAALGAAGQAAIEQLVAHWKARGDRLADELAVRGVTTDQLQQLASTDEGALLLAKAGQAAALSFGDGLIRALSSSISLAIEGDGLAEVLVETLSRMTQADLEVLRLLESTWGKKQSGGYPEGAPPEIVARLVGLGVLSFDGLYRGISALGRTVLDTAR